MSVAAAPAPAATASAAPPVIELRGVAKRFGSVSALRGVDLAVSSGEVVALLGDNGAGKSTLIRIISGVHRPDDGEMRIDGRAVGRWSVAAARAAGIETVHQDRALAPQQTIVRNVFMGRELTGRLGFIDHRREREACARLLREMGFTSGAVHPDALVATLSGGERQGVAIARALLFRARLIILDEPTTALSVGECEKVFRFVRRIRDEGSSCLYISHDIWQTWELADRFVIIDRGRSAYAAAKAELGTCERLIEVLKQLAATGAVPASREAP